jgi:predicted ribosomally synthesized peptide with SipW-like signal peptide
MKLRIATSILTIVAVVGGVSATTNAFFTDTGTSSDNLFTTGDLNMKLTDSDQTDQDNVSATFGIAGGAPGTTFSQNLNIRNTGSVDANHMTFQFSNLVTESATPPGDALTVHMDRTIEITTLNWDSDNSGSQDYDLLALVSDLNGNGIKDLDDVESFGALSTVPYGGTQATNHQLHIEGRYSPTLMTSEHMGDSVNTTLAVTMTQE